MFTFEFLAPLTEGPLFLLKTSIYPPLVAFDCSPMVIVFAYFIPPSLLHNHICPRLDGGKKVKEEADNDDDEAGESYVGQKGAIAASSKAKAKSKNKKKKEKKDDEKWVRSQCSP